MLMGHPILNQQYLSLTSILHKCKSMAQFKQAHARLVITGEAYPSSAFRPVVSFSALDPSGDIDYAFLLLVHSPAPQTLFPFNTLIRGFARKHDSDSLTNSVFIFRQIPEFGLSPNNFTFTFLFQCCSNSLQLNLGRQLHSMIAKTTVQDDIFVRNSIIQFYSVCGRLDDARHVFNESSRVDVVSWNSLINGCLRNEDLLGAIALFDKMPERNSISWNTMIAGLVKFGLLDEATRLFNDMPTRNLISWVIMISGCSQNGWQLKALELFKEMQLLGGPEPNAAILVSILSSASQLGALTNGKWVHLYIEKRRKRIDSMLSAALIDMYAKCGCINLAMQVFESSPEKDVYNYTAAISGLATNGQGEKSIWLFEQMQCEGIKPDSICYIAVLCACSHMGWVERGFDYFYSMTKVHKIEPELDHYACMVDLLGRAGLLVEAERFITSMPIRPDTVVWGALLGSCRLHKNPEMAKRVGSLLLESDHDHDGRYVVLSNIYAESNRGHEAQNVWNTMKRRRIKRVPGSSSIEVEGVIHEFVAGDRSHEESDDIYVQWENIMREIKKAGYIVETQGVILDVEEEEKENAVGFHSEKLALAYGFIHTNAGSELRIVKNIRICNDCHSAIKLVSMCFNRKIVVRDRKQFHHFEAGSCSCMDYW
ncbi:pentatricopeptide repeat-containing protein At5g66520-like [Aristolochia californica]|uniref:pentatricopeptide repeat-containing protein At5g66520-like n=1 Tax=Aristolochia californica TaxID=171875 RepID=UPI0035D58EAE